MLFQNRKVKLVSLLFICVALLLSACGSSSEPKTTDTGEKTKTNSESSTDIKMNPAGELPITDEKVTLQVLMLGEPLVENFATNAFTKWLEEQTNVKIEWEIVPKNAAIEKLNVTLAGGDYPDVIMGFPINTVQQSLYGKDGVFLALNDLIEEYGVETKKMFENSPNVKGLITAPDGNIYALPQVNECYHCMMSSRMWINQDWLEALKLDMPTTTEEYYEVLKAFKEKDPNGNKIADEIPLAGYTEQGNVSFASFIMSSFVKRGNEDLIIDNGEIKASFVQPGWKEGTLYMKRLYDEGLIASESFTQDRNSLKRMASSGEQNIVGSFPQNWIAEVVDVNTEKGMAYAHTVPPLKGPGGVQSTPYNPFSMKQGQFVITDKAKYPEIAFRLADFMYSEEASIRSNVGVFETDWEAAAPGDKGIDGREGVWKKVAKPGGVQPVQNNRWVNTGPSYRSKDFRFGEVELNANGGEQILYNETSTKYEPYRLDVDEVVPPMFFTQEQSEELANLLTTISDYKNQFLARAITGDIDVEKEWDNYLLTLESMKLERFLQIHQEAYESYIKNK
ncbi:extracellular solute-binding protein [Paenibacillus yanchengensis]|uniref:Extracellular solute-binding protein n=1 Tax=Paenibacillus yanchengensis TaxID=2035833 RepID=A0ABW4YRI9_9BACL